MRRVFEGRTGTVAAFLLGLVIATAGTASAARLITGKQVKDGSISEKDLSKAVRAQLAKARLPGPPGPKGDAGPPGPSGQTGAAGPGTLLTAAVDVPDGTFGREVLRLPGLGFVTSSCSNTAPDYSVGFRNTSGRTIEWESDATTGAGGSEGVGTAADGGYTGGISANGNVTIQVTLPAQGAAPATVAVIRIAQRLLGSVCRVSVSALSN